MRQESPWRSAFLLLACWACFGCASTAPLAIDSGRLVRSFQEFVYAPLKPNTDVSASLAGDLPAFAFAEGKSPYLAYRLPALPTGSAFNVKSYVNYKTVPWDPYVLRPHVLFLGEAYDEVGKVLDLPFRNGQDFWIGPFFRAEVEVPKGAAYVVLYSSDTLLSPLTLYAANGTPWDVKPLRVGNLTLQVRGATAQVREEGGK